jgi:hypothetical protein
MLRRGALKMIPHRELGRRTKRQARDALRALADKPGMGDRFWADQKRESERRMQIIDAAPREWRDLVNAYDQDAVADLAGAGYGVEQAARRLIARIGNAI